MTCRENVYTHTSLQVVYYKIYNKKEKNSLRTYVGKLSTSARSAPAAAVPRQYNLSRVAHHQDMLLLLLHVDLVVCFISVWRLLQGVGPTGVPSSQHLEGQLSRCTSGSRSTCKASYCCACFCTLYVHSSSTRAKSRPYMHVAASRFFFGMDSNHRKVKKHSTSSSHDLVYLVTIYIRCSVYVSIFIIINSNIVIKTKSKIEY